MLNTRLAENFKTVEGRIREACARVGRRRSEVKLIAVSKTVEAESVAAAVETGQFDFGENYIQHAKSNIARLHELGVKGARFHMIGHLQRNKAKDAIAIFQSLHSLESKRLLDRLQKELRTAGAGRFECFVEINTSGEGSKFGLEPEEAPGLVEAAQEAQHVEVAGLMTMAPFLADPQDCRKYFVQLRELRDKINEKLGNPVLRYLSMGMTNDFEVALEEGATHLRIGTALFRT